ncbi:hypothetical protein ACIQUU_14380 [Streptomyces sp. NPDC101116]|uniref:hypothetical protein n=1 Tax=Streptomyces sp. NPDC101116 TaxID=3366107 RepID=UPI0037FD9624
MTSYDPSNVDYNGSVFAAFKTKFSTAPYWNGLEFNIQHDGSSLPPLGQDLHIFGNWPAVASTLHRRLYYTSGLDPASGLYSGDLFAKFRYLFSTSPFWNIHFNIVTREVKVKNSSFRPVVEAIRAYCESAEIAPAAGREIASNLGYGLHLALHQGEMAQKRTLLQNSMIAITDGMLHVTLVYAMLEMKRPQQGQGYRVLAQDTQLVIGDGVLDYAFCKRHANSILAYDSTDIGDWKAMAAANRWEYTVCDDDSRDVAVPRP